MRGRRLILLMSVSMDGYVARDYGVMDWLGSGEHGDQRHRLNVEFASRIDLIVMGSGACIEMERGWSGSDSPMARYMNTLPKLVLSQSLEDTAWSNAQITRRPLAEEIAERKREDGLDMVIFGGARIAQAALRERLVDELRLTVHPVALGDGLPLWHDLAEPQRYELVSSTVYADGSVTQVLRPGS